MFVFRAINGKWIDWMNSITRNILGEEVTVTWNYRLMQRIEGAGTNFEETVIYIVEVYYDDDGKLIGWTNEKTVYGEDIAEIRQTLEWMALALDKPILIESELLAEAEQARETGRSDIFASEAFEPVSEGRTFDTAEEAVDYLSSLEEGDDRGIVGGSSRTPPPITAKTRRR